MFAKYDQRARPSAAGGWDQPREWSTRTRLVVGLLVAVALVVGMIALMVYVDDNAGQTPQLSGQPE